MEKNFEDKKHMLGANYPFILPAKTQVVERIHVLLQKAAFDRDSLCTTGTSENSNKCIYALKACLNQSSEKNSGDIPVFKKVITKLVSKSTSLQPRVV